MIQSPSQRPVADTGEQQRREAWLVAIRRLRIAIGILGTVLLGLLVRALTSGFTASIDWSAAIVATLLLTAIGIHRYGRQAEPPATVAGDAHSPRDPAEAGH